MLIATADKICITKGDDALLTVLVDGYEMQDGDTMTLTVRNSSADTGTALKTFTSSTNVLTLGHTATGALAVGEYSADIQITTDDGLIYTVWPLLPDAFRSRDMNFRNFVVMPEVTK